MNSKDLELNVNVKKDGLEDLADTMERIGDVSTVFGASPNPTKRI